MEIENPILSRLSFKYSKLVTDTTERLLIFLPLVAFFLPLDIFFIFGLASCILVIINVKRFSTAIVLRKNYLYFIFSLYMLLLAYSNQNIMGLVAVFFLVLITIYVSFLRLILSKKLYESIMVVIGSGTFFSIYYSSIDFYTTSTYRLYEFFMKLIPLDYTFITEIADGVRSASTYVDPNFYGHISAFIALIASSYILSSLKKVYHKEWKYLLKLIFYLIVLGVNLFALNLTQSRSAFVGLIVGAAVLMIIFDARIFIAVSIPVFMFIVFKYDAFLSMLPRLDSAALSLEYRLSLYKAAFREIMKNPFFGKGFYTYPLVYQNYDTGYQLHTHNLFLELWLDSGLIGLALLAGYFSSYIKRPLDQWVKRNKEYLPLVGGILALEFVNGLSDAVLIFPQSFILLSLVLLSLEINDKQSLTPVI